MPRLLGAVLSQVYRSIAKRFPPIVPVYRYIAPRERYPPFRRKFAAGELHDAIRKEFGQDNHGFFFEAGANDGIVFSNTAYLERYCGWKGLLVEAVPHKFIACLRNRQAAIVEHAGSPAVVRLHAAVPQEGAVEQHQGAGGAAAGYGVDPARGKNL